MTLTVTNPDGLIGISVTTEYPFSIFQVKILECSYDLIVDALFGFGFRPPLKPDFLEIVKRIASLAIPLASIDVPSGQFLSKFTFARSNLVEFMKVRSELCLKLEADRYKQSISQFPEC